MLVKTNRYIKMHGETIKIINCEFINSLHAFQFTYVCSLVKFNHHGNKW